MSKLKQILDKIEEIKTIQKEVRQRQGEVNDLISDIEQIFDLGITHGDLITALKLAKNTMRVLELAKELAEEEAS